MSYLITQTFVSLLIAALLGLVLGWYLTRIAAVATRATLQGRLKSVEADARELRGELDAAVNARGACEAERKAMSEELGVLKARQVADPAELAALQAELAACREALDAARDPQPAVPARAVSIVVPDAAIEPDDLQQIKGIGPKIAGILKELGILRFEQIAAWTPDNVDWVNEHLQFKGRIEREEWIPQAQAFVAARASKS